MNSFQQVIRLCASVVLVFFLALSNLNLAFSTPTIAEVSAGNKVKGTLERAEGKTQQAIGNLTGDREAQIEGKVKQAEGQLRSVPGGANSEDEIIGKTQQAESNIRRYQSDEYQTSNPKQAVEY